MKPTSKKTTPANEFAKFGIYNPVLKGLVKKGYKNATPIQRKAIPELMEKNDVVAMARTGSGKTGAFVIPLLHHLKTHSAKVGARALILAPSRELALQTKTYIDKVGHYTDLRSVVLVGGESIQEQFSNVILNNPDIIIATPGRLLQVVDELAKDGNKFFQSIEFVIADEADQLFELGLAPQVYAVFDKLPSADSGRVTALFSATLPKAILQLVRVALREPKLIRLDVEAQLSPTLDMVLLSCVPTDKEAILLHLLSDATSPLNSTRIVGDDVHGGMIFCATKHHVEYLHELLTLVDIPHGCLYGTMDAMARTETITDFRKRSYSVLIATDLAARGLDIPFLQWVLHYDFPAQEKLFIHRAGRVARAGRPGSAIAFITPEDLPYLADLASFLNKDVSTSESSDSLCLGRLPKNVLDPWIEKVASINSQHSATLPPLKQVSQNAFKLYAKSRPSATPIAFDRAKSLLHSNNGLFPLHPKYASVASEDATNAEALLANLRNWKPTQTVFEAMQKNTKGPSIDPTVALLQKRRHLLASKKQTEAVPDLKITRDIDAPVDEDELRTLFRFNPPKANKDAFADSFKMSYEPSGKSTEDGLKLNKTSTASFLKEVANATLDLVNTSDKTTQTSSKGRLVWDSKKKNFIKVFANHTKPEEGSSFTSSNQKASSNPNDKKRKVGELFQDWKKKYKMDLPRIGETELSATQRTAIEGSKKIDYRGRKKGPNSKKKSPQSTDGKPAPKGKRPVVKNELKSNEQIMKARRQSAKEAQRLSAKKPKSKKK